MRISLEAWSSRMRRPTLKLYCLWGTGCGAIKGAIDHVELGNLNGLLAKIRPAVDETQYSGDRSSKNDEFVDAAAKTNVRRTIDAIRNGSNVLAPMEKDGNVASGNGCAWAKPTGSGQLHEKLFTHNGFGMVFVNCCEDAFTLGFAKSREWCGRRIRAVEFARRVWGPEGPACTHPGA